MRFTISIPQNVPDGTFDAAALRAYLARAEALGFESAWTGEQVIGSMPHLGPIEMMSYAAACTERIRIGCIAFVSSLHNPLQLAKSMATLDQLSRGRLEIGLATGGRTRMFSAFGVDAETFVSRFNEGLQLMKTLWTEPRVTFEGRFWQLHGAAMEPKPFQKLHPPIWFGGSHPNALPPAVRYANGVFGAGSQNTAQFRDPGEGVGEAPGGQNRDPSTFPIAKRVYIAVDDSAARARERITAALEEQYGYFGIKGLGPVAVAGPPEACVQGLREVFDAGAEMILLNPLFDDLQQ